MSATRPPIHDERTSGSTEPSRRGAHRARAKPAAAGLPVLAGVLVVCLVVSIAYLVLGQRGGDEQAGSNLEAAAGPVSTASITAAPKSSVQASAPAAQRSAPAAQQSAPAAQQTQKATTGQVNRNAKLAVLNATGVKGLAARVASRIEPAGWSVGRTGNATPAQQGTATSKVYYGAPAGKATATALVKDLGYGQAVQDASVIRNGDVGNTGLIVVLGMDSTR